MIKYLGIQMTTSPDKAMYSLLEIVQFEVLLLNTIQDKRFTLRIRCSSACITGKDKIAPEFVTFKSQLAIKRYCKLKAIALDPDLDALISEIKTGVEECCKAWLNGNKDYAIIDL